MRISSSAELDAALRGAPAPVYLVFGDEPLQSGEAADAIRKAVRARGFVGWEVHFVQTGFSWAGLRESADTLSLFGDKRLLDVRFPEKPEREAAEWLEDYATDPPVDCVLLLSVGKLAADDQKKAWFRSIEKIGVVLQVRALDGAALIQWLDRRMNSRGLLADRSGLQLLAARVEGNLLAAAQEIEKLAILYGQGRIEDGQIATAVADSARYNVFDLVDAVLADRGNRAHRILEGLRNEDVAPAIVLWALARETRQLSAAAFALSKGERLDAVLGRQKVWDSRRKIWADALKRLDVDAWHECLLVCARTDRIIKGQESGGAWDALIQVCLAMSGRRGAVARSERIGSG